MIVSTVIPAIDRDAGLLAFGPVLGRLDAQGPHLPAALAAVPSVVRGDEEPLPQQVTLDRLLTFAL